MVAKDNFQRYLDAGIAFTNMTRAKAEDLVAELVRNGEFQSSDARARVEELLERSRKSREAFATQVKTEVTHQLSALGITSLEDLAQQVAALIGRTAEAGKAATSGTKAAARKAARKTTGKKSPAKKSAAKKSAAKKAPAKKATAKSPAKKAAAKKAPAKKATTKSPAGGPAVTKSVGTTDAPAPGSSA